MADQPITSLAALPRLTPQQLKDQHPAAFAAVADAKVEQPVKDAVTEHVAAAIDSSAVVAPVAMDVPIESQPVLAQELGVAQVHVLGATVGLPAAKVDKVAAAAASPLALDDAVLDR